MLLLANFANTKWCKKTEKWLNPWQIGTHLRVLTESFLMNTNMIGFRWFAYFLPSCAFGKSSPSSRRVKAYAWVDNPFVYDEGSWRTHVNHQLRKIILSQSVSRKVFKYFQSNPREVFFFYPNRSALCIGQYKTLLFREGNLSIQWKIAFCIISTNSKQLLSTPTLLYKTVITLHNIETQPQAVKLEFMYLYIAFLASDLVHTAQLWIWSLYTCTWHFCLLIDPYWSAVC